MPGIVLQSRPVPRPGRINRQNAASWSLSEPSLFGAYRLERIDRQHARSCSPRGQHRHGEQDNARADKRGRGRSIRLKNEMRQKASTAERSRYTAKQSGRNRQRTLPQKRPAQGSVRCAQRHADAHLALTLRDYVQCGSVNARGGEQQCHEPEEEHGGGIKTWFGEHFVAALLERLHIVNSHARIGRSNRIAAARQIHFRLPGDACHERERRRRLFLYRPEDLRLGIVLRTAKSFGLDYTDYYIGCPAPGGFDVAPQNHRPEPASLSEGVVDNNRLLGVALLPERKIAAAEQPRADRIEIAG